MNIKNNTLFIILQNTRINRNIRKSMKSIVEHQSLLASKHVQSENIFRISKLKVCNLMMKHIYNVTSAKYNWLLRLLFNNSCNTKSKLCI